MTHRHSIRNILVTVGAAVVALTAFSAQAEVQPGNYQTHVLPSTTRHTADHADRPVQALVDHGQVAESRVPAGNYQSHVLPNTTRRDLPTRAVSMNNHDVAMNSRSTRR